MQQTENKWNELELLPLIQEFISNNLKFEFMMPVQKTVIPLFLKNYDVAVESCTGSGKTLAFLIPIFNKFIKQIENENFTSIFTLILVPTRELAIQINQIIENFVKFLKEKNIQSSSMMLIGGEHQKNNDQICESHFITGTPGRIYEILFEQNVELNFKNFEILVMDEADRLIETNLQFDIKKILQKIPKQRRTGLFSATLSGIKIQELVKYGLRNPVSIKLRKDKEQEQKFSIPENLSNFYFYFQRRFEKIVFLMNFLKKHKKEKILVFFNTCKSVDFYSSIIEGYINQKVIKIHGKMKQEKRSKRFKDFISINSGILCTTDVLARGIDFENIQKIIQVDLPQNPQFYIHRIGRTARGNFLGQAYLLVSENEIKYIDYLENQGVNFKVTKNQDFQINETYKKLQKIMLRDKMNFIRANHGFISYIQSYKEHQLKEIFIFSELDLEDLTQSFLIPQIPFIKETRELKGKIMDENYLEEYKKTEFRNKNQEKQWNQKKEQNVEKIKKKIEKRKKTQRTIQKQQNKKQKSRGYHERKKAKERELENEFDEYRHEEKLKKKLKKGKISVEEYDRQIQKLDQKYERQQIQLKIKMNQINFFKKENKINIEYNQPFNQK